MKKLLRCGRFGAFYGSWSGAVLGVLIALYGAVETLFHWPKDGTVRWFIEGSLSILMFSFIGGYIVGFAGGFVFGLIGSQASGPLGWSVIGIVGGFVSSCFFTWLLWSTVRSSTVPDFLSFWLNSIPIGFLPCVVLGVIGWVVGLAMRRGFPNIPRLDWIRDR